MRPTILIALGHYLPGYRMGGPLRSVLGLVEQLSDEFAFRVLTLDRDLGDTAPYPGIVRSAWQPTGRTMVYYAPPEELRLAGLARIVSATPHDLLYLNSFFSARFSIMPLLARRLDRIPDRPLVLAPRGEFSAGALAIRSLRKRLYMTGACAGGLLDRVQWHASTPLEEEDIRAALGRHIGPIHVAADLPSTLSSKPPTHSPRPAGAPLRTAFLSRISPKKNLDYALRVLAQVRSPVDFDIHGPPEDQGYLQLCRQFGEALPQHVRVRWMGAVAPEDVPATLAGYDLFFLPTRGENFGHVIAESLGAGTPVLLSDTTPWRGLDAAGVGHDLPLSEPQAFVASIEQAAAEPADAALARRDRAFRFATEHQSDGASVLANRLLFRAALGTRR